MVDKKTIKRIQDTVWDYFEKYGRHDLPWRKTKNPYHILVSEVMLQQTQVTRVIPKYKAFLKQFPTIQSLADAPLRDVLVAWQGLGYNRRAKALHEAAKCLVKDYGGRIPKAFDELCTLPGVGPYTAGAISAFAYNTPIPIIETNIRTVLFYFAFKKDRVISDVELMKLSEACLDTEKPREWYWALMDYGAHLKENGIRVNSKSKHYVKQSKFKGSDREVRGAILRELSTFETLSLLQLQKKIHFESSKIKEQLLRLEKEAFVSENKGKWTV